MWRSRRGRAAASSAAAGSSSCPSWASSNSAGRFGPEFRGRGFATEASAGCLAWGFANLGVERVAALVDAENEASIAVAHRLGMEPTRETVSQGEKSTVFEITRSAFAVRPAEGGKLRTRSAYAVRSA